MKGCHIKATVSRPIRQGHERFEVESAGLLNIDSDSSYEHKAYIEARQFDDLSGRLYDLGIETTTEELEAMARPPDED